MCVSCSDPLLLLSSLTLSGPSAPSPFSPHRRRSPLPNLHRSALHIQHPPPPHLPPPLAIRREREREFLLCDHACLGTCRWGGHVGCHVGLGTLEVGGGEAEGGEPCDRDEPAGRDEPGGRAERTEKRRTRRGSKRRNDDRRRRRRVRNLTTMSAHPDSGVWARASRSGSGRTRCGEDGRERKREEDKGGCASMTDDG